MKRCNRCGNDKPLSEFYQYGKKTLTPCKACKSEQNKRWKKTEAGQRKKKRDLEKARLERLMVKLWALQQLGITKCLKCPEDNPICLDFHHIEKKDKEVARLFYESKKDELLVEAKKCVVLCANCHRKEHAAKIAALLATLSDTRESPCGDRTQY
jgi:hypothetical protein